MAAEKNKNIQIDISTTQILSFADLPTQLVPIQPMRYVGKLLSVDNGSMKVGVCIEHREEQVYRENDEIVISYIELKMMYSFRARITMIREVQEYDKFNIDSMGDNITRYIGYNLCIFYLTPLNEPIVQQRREYFRVPLPLEIYYKSYMTGSDIKTLKFEIEMAKEYKRNADEGILEKEEGYKKLHTIDISAGGFRSKSIDFFETGTVLDCMIIVDNEALPVLTKILSCKVDEMNSKLFDTRASFFKISDPVRDRLIKFFFLQQRQMQNKFTRRR